MDFTQILITAIPVLGSVGAALIALSRSTKAEKHANQIEFKSASRQDFAAVTSAYKELYEAQVLAYDKLRDRVQTLETIIITAGLAAELVAIQEDTNQ